MKRGVGTENDDGALPLLKKAAEINGSEPGEPVKSTPPYPFATEAEPGNPSVIPAAILKQFHFAFLIRHPKHSIPSYYRCTIPPLDKVTGFYNFMPAEAGYDEQRRVFDYLRENGQIGPKVAGQQSNGINGHAQGTAEICVIDADDLLDHPATIIETFCKSVGIEYSPEMLNWDNEEDHDHAKNAFEKWKGFHEDAIHSTELKARTHVSLLVPTCAYVSSLQSLQKKAEKTDEQFYAEWVEKYGEEGAKVIKQTVADNVKDYEYLKQFAIKV